ncbi:MAG: hypothetical protein JXA21_27075 [Anaerolineae bacterium]|nr:hypothetical protein [Anaerolineae bacterium]
MNTNMLKRWLPRIAVIGLAMVLISVGVLTPLRRTMTTMQDDANRIIREQIGKLQPETLTDEDFLTALEQMRQSSPNITGIWLFTREGEILRSYNRSITESNVDEWVTDETQRILEIVPQESLTRDQQVELMAASVMQREGEHNDIYRQTLIQVYDSDGTLLGWVGFTLEANMAIRTPGAFWITMVLIGLVGMLIYWLSLPIWTWLDAQQRGERAWVWATFVLIGNLVALIAYILARAPQRQPD